VDAGVAHDDFAALDPMLRVNMVHEDTAAEFSGVLHWLRSAAPVRPIAAWLRPMLPQSALLHPAGCFETPLRFGPNNRLFGVLCQPADVASSTVVIFGNSGRDPHQGITRSYVEMARQLAQSGVASLRMDFAGLGDSIGPNGAEDVFSHMFETDRSPDVTAAIDALQELGFSQFAVAGNCAGAFHGLHAGLADSRISTMVLINLPQFQWKDGDDVDIAYRAARTPLYYISQLCRRSGWGELMRGEVNVPAIVRVQLQKLSNRMRNLAARGVWHLSERLGIDIDRRPIGTLSFAQAAMARLARRQVRTLFMFASDDVGLVEMAREFGHDYRMLPRFGGAAIEVIPGLDHNMKNRSARATAIAAINAFLAASPLDESVSTTRFSDAEPRRRAVGFAQAR
jgi:hypothetical protein